MALTPTADAPIKDIHTFHGVLTLNSTQDEEPAQSLTPLTVENVLWANTVLAAGSAVGLIVYTGKQTRAALNTSEPETKTGTLEREVNKMAKVCSTSSRAHFPDPLHGHLCFVCGSCCSQRVSWPVVHLRLSLSHSVLINHSHQVR